VPDCFTKKFGSGRDHLWPQLIVMQFEAVTASKFSGIFSS